MSPSEANRRITLSQQSLSRYIEVTAAGVDLMPGTMQLVHDEIAILENMAADHPRYAAELIFLASEWVAFQAKLKSKMH